MSITQICRRLDAILKFMTPYWPWVNCHMVNFLTDNHWQTFVPEKLQEELKNQESIGECIESIFWTNDGKGGLKFSQTLTFLQETEANSLTAFPEIVLTKKEFEETVLKIYRQEENIVSIKEFLSEKKRHEVEITASLVNDLIQGTLRDRKIPIIVDAGDGKGYLSSRLALEYGYQVLGIDSNPTNTENAIERNRKLKKAWNGLKERAELQSKGITPPRRGRQKQKPLPTDATNAGDTCNMLDNYKTMDKFITTDLNLPNLIEQTYPNADRESTVCLTGLHTCGNLAATCLKLFEHQTQCKLVCNIGCCYHLLREIYSGTEFFGNKQISDLNQEFGFPLSSYLQSKHLKLGRNARMLAAQSIDRTRSSKELPNISLFYRSLFEVLVCEQRPELKDTIQVGKLKKFNNFGEYVELCKKKYLVLQDIPLERVHTLAAEVEKNKHYLDMFYLLRMSFAPVLESIILLDRLLFLLEKGHDKSYLVAAFDAVVSPRRFAIISIKE
ncbi:probable methyltransferase-like protein 25 [Stomoxys calcitrans]|uniref:probable methyltransferase-like protein 25 n=1 Tax=Stomoxys calcitrans TaxID=35570 RepID=UPI0027E387F0|nr:probable methyltransferase-like protein 25 [Stomoxys calcitrans]